MKAVLATILSLGACVQAHMHLNYPPALNAPNNPYTEGSGDQNMDDPFNCCGKRHEYPCKGALKYLDTPAGRPVATWKAGSTYSWNITGQSNHYGGSCQIGISVDRGQTFRVLKSYEGNCPRRNNGEGPEGQDFDFQLPDDVPAGNAIFAWSWVNREQELNMNCASIEIEGGAAAPVDPPSSSSSGSPSSGVTQPTGSRAPVTGSATSSVATPTSVSRSRGRGRKGRVGQQTAASVNGTPATSADADASATPATGVDLNMDGCTCKCDGTAIDASGRLALTDCSCVCTGSQPQSQSQEEAEESASPRYGGRQRKGPHRQGHRHQKRAGSSVAFSERPEMLAIDIGNGCLSPLTTAELKYPNPGPDVVEGDGEYRLELPSGNC